ncbi:TonB-dependent siderophore receptor [Parafrankia sp. BMG5.11]|uniref:TonB-dependent receptor plug domain-containing protein n=1 Tax=Parafrankia sp. BMG5.11 TaxID=222540 RepID=UPI00103E53E3|nr:TonB-dependent receptor [Parafrankia sp. BMG5.11]TCJ39464.1 TonB-dependent receptor [Parafrankia sp. BMG5.11]
MPKYLFLLSVAACASSAAAQIPDTGITVTATGTRSEVEVSGQPVTVIGEAEIDAVQGADIARVLRRAPGVTITRNGPPGAFTGVRVRGAAAEQLLVLIDGVRVADPAAPGGGFDFGNLAAGEVEKLDLLRGSNSTIWGSDAIGGVLLVTTRNRRGLTASGEYGADDSSYLTASGGVGSDAFFLGGSAGWQRTDGFSAAASGSEADGSEQWSGNLRARAYLSPALELFALGRYVEGDLDLDGYPAPSFTFADTDERQHTRQYTGAGGAIYDSGPLYLRGAYSFADTERATFDTQDSAAPNYTTDGHSQRVDLRGEWRPIGPLIVNFGGESEWTRFATSFDAVERTSIWGAYAQAGIELGKLAAHAGLRHDRHARFGGETSMGADASYEVAPDLRVRASYGEGFKAPTLFQLLSDYGNAALQPERSRSFDVGLAWRTRAAPTWGAVTLYRRDSSDLIDFVSCFGVSGGICTGRPFGTYDNVSRARAQGFEVEFGLAPSERLRTSVAYSYLDAEDRATGNRLARRPRHALTATADWSAPFGLTLGGDVRLVGDSFDDAGNFTALDGYVLTDVRASVPLGDTFELFGRIENLFDARYTEVAGYGTRGRAAFVGARVRL